MGGRHVLWLGDESSAAVLAHVAGDSPIAVEDLDHLSRSAYIDWFMDQLVGHRVVAGIQLHVIIDIHLA